MKHNPTDYCGNCGELLAALHVTPRTAVHGDDGTLYCSEECMEEAEMVLAEAAFEHFLG
jgi:hypothetical protein